MKTNQMHAIITPKTMPAMAPLDKPRLCPHDAQSARSNLPIVLLGRQEGRQTCLRRDQGNQCRSATTAKRNNGTERMQKHNVCVQTQHVVASVNA